MNITHEMPETEFTGDAGSITGTAVYEATIDCGEMQWCFLDHVKVDGLKLRRDQMAKVCTMAGVERGEDIAQDEIMTAFNAGDYEDVA